MAAKAAPTIEGVNELMAKLKMLASPQEVEKISYRGVFPVAKMVKEAAVQQAHALGAVDKGVLVKNIAIKRIKIGTQRGYTLGVRARMAHQKMGNDPYYWWWVHFGSIHNDPPKPFISNAYASIRGIGISKISDSALKAIASSAERALRKYGNGKAA
jgi:hypothetical protein